MAAATRSGRSQPASWRPRALTFSTYSSEEVLSEHSSYIIHDLKATSVFGPSLTDREAQCTGDNESQPL